VQVIFLQPLRRLAGNDGTDEEGLMGKYLIRAKSLAAISISIIIHALAGIFWQGFAGQSRSFHCALPFLRGGF